MQIFVLFVARCGFLLLFTKWTVVSYPNLQHKCSYQVPRVQDVIFGVLLDESSNNDTIESKSRTRRQIPYRNLRIKRFYDTSINELPLLKQNFIKQKLLPDATGYWEKALYVKRAFSSIRLNRKCNNSQYYVHPTTRIHSCAGSCRKLTKCGEVVVPNQHLFQCRYCRTSNPNSCTVSGPSNGPGVADADFVLYVSAVASERCSSPDTVAYAAHCQQEAELDRPIAGHVNLCPQSISTELHDQEVLSSTVKHEILHALGFSAGLYAFFRDQDGKPRTKRNIYGKPLKLDTNKGYYEWNDNTIRTIVREDWWTRHGQVEHTVEMVVTPKVIKEVRNHYDCESLEGAELENQGGDGTAMTHWEKRLFENEAMTGTHTQNPVYSRITLALMEDSGWYRADYSVAEHLHWGESLGCLFAKKSCGDWIKLKKQRGLSSAPYCDQVKRSKLNPVPSATTTCTSTRDSLALCNLVQYNGALDKVYQNFDKLSGVSKREIGSFGGSVELADFCPYDQVLDLSSNKIYHFPCAHWLATRKEDHKVRRTLECKKSKFIHQLEPTAQQALAPFITVARGPPLPELPSFTGQTVEYKQPDEKKPIKTGRVIVLEPTNQPSESSESTDDEKSTPVTRDRPIVVAQTEVLVEGKKKGKKMAKQMGGGQMGMGMGMGMGGGQMGRAPMGAGYGGYPAYGGGYAVAPAYGYGYGQPYGYGGYGYGAPMMAMGFKGHSWSWSWS